MNRLLPIPLLLLAGCTDPEGDAEIAVRWLPERGTCRDVGADTFHLELGPAGDPLDVPCSDQEMLLEFPLGIQLDMAATLASAGKPVTVRLETGPFDVPPGGADVRFDFAIRDFLHESDLRFVVSYTGAATCQAAAVSAQRITLTHGDGSPVEGAEVCDSTGADCVPADGTAGPCRTQQQVIPGLRWGRYTMGIVGVAPVSCYYRTGVPVQIDFSAQVREFQVSRPDVETPCQ